MFFEVANYPFDERSPSSSSSVSPDDAIFRQLAKSYSLAHSKMRQGHPCNDGDTFKVGASVELRRCETHICWHLVVVLDYCLRSLREIFEIECVYVRSQKPVTSTCRI